MAADREVLGVLAELQAPKRQPNLLFASVRYLYGAPTGWTQFRNWVFERRDEIVTVIRVRRTQTNEPARCATLLPLLATLPQPLALLEVGAAAGLCLLADRYAYDYNSHNVAPSRPVAAVAPHVQMPRELLNSASSARYRRAWRAGLDLDPLDVRDNDQMAWLEALVWPGEGHRLELLRAATEVAKLDPPALFRGDLCHDLPSLAAQAPSNATLVVFHTAVLAYVPDRRERAAFAETVGELDAVWVANEAPGLVSHARRPDHAYRSDAFLLTQTRNRSRGPIPTERASIG